MKHGDKLPDSSMTIEGRSCPIVNRTYLEREAEETEAQKKLRIRQNKPPVMIRYVVGRIER